MKSNANRSADYANVLQTLITSAKLLQEATESSTQPIASGPLLDVAIDRLETLKTLKANRDLGEELAEKIVYQVSAIFHELSRPTASEDSSRLLSESVTRYTTALTEAHDALTRLTHRGTLGKSIMRGRDRRELQGLTTAMDEEYNVFMETIGKQQGRQREFRRSLHIGSAAGFDVAAVPGRVRSPSPSPHPPTKERHVRCWPGTRITLLDEINSWATSATQAAAATSTSTSLIYWLADIPGSGKSTIAADLADEWRHEGILGGFYDAAFRPSIHEEADTIDPLCQSWAEQLGSAFSELSTPIFRAISDVHRSSASSRSFQHQLKSLILQPLRQLRRDRRNLSPQAKIVFVLDSLNEYPPSRRLSVLRAIKAVNATHGVKFLLVSSLPTGENDSDMILELLDSSPSLVTRGSINIHSPSNMADILLYLTSQFQLHSATFHNHPQFRGAFIDSTIRVLAKRSEGLILWARLAFDMLLAADNPTKVLLSLVDEDSLGDLNGLYLESVLQAQAKLDRLNEAPTGGSTGEERDHDHDHDHDQHQHQPSAPSLLPPPLNLLSTGQKNYPKNALAMVLSAIGYAQETLSIWMIAELTGLGLERTLTVLQYLNTVIDSGQPPLSSIRASPPSPIPGPRPRSSSKLNSPSSYISVPSKKRSSFHGCDGSFSPPPRKLSYPEPVSSRLLTSSPVAQTFSPTDKPMHYPSSIRSPSREKRKSTDVPPPSPSKPIHGLNMSAEAARRTYVKARHSTFRDWVRLPHPPTLLSCLAGKNVIGQDDLRFVVAPTNEMAHAMLAKGCLALIRGSTAMTEDGRDSSLDGSSSGLSAEEIDASVEDISYSCRYWAIHCARLLETLQDTSLGFYLASTASGGARWKGLRSDMLEFFTRKLLWWADLVLAHNWVADAIAGLRALDDVLHNISPEEESKSTVEQLVQWTTEAKRLLERSQGGSVSVPGEERDSESSLLWKYYGDEIARRTTTVQLRPRDGALAFNDTDDDLLPPPPPIFDDASMSSPVSSPDRKPFISRGRAAKASSSSNVAFPNTDTDKATSVSTKVTSSTRSEPHVPKESALQTVAVCPSTSPGPTSPRDILKPLPMLPSPSPSPPLAPPPKEDLNTATSMPTATHSPREEPALAIPEHPPLASSPAEEKGIPSPIPLGAPMTAKPARPPIGSPVSPTNGSLFPALSLFSSNFVHSPIASKKTSGMSSRPSNGTSTKNTEGVETAPTAEKVSPMERSIESLAAPTSIESASAAASEEALSIQDSSAISPKPEPESVPVPASSRSRAHSIKEREKGDVPGDGNEAYSKPPPPHTPVSPTSSQPQADHVTVNPAVVSSLGSASTGATLFIDTALSQTEVPLFVGSIGTSPAPSREASPIPKMEPQHLGPENEDAPPKLPSKDDHAPPSNAVGSMADDPPPLPEKNPAVPSSTLSATPATAAIPTTPQKADSAPPAPPKDSPPSKVATPPAEPSKPISTQTTSDSRVPRDLTGTSAKATDAVYSSSSRNRVAPPTSGLVPGPSPYTSPIPQSPLFPALMLFSTNFGHSSTLKSSGGQPSSKTSPTSKHTSPAKPGSGVAEDKGKKTHVEATQGTSVVSPLPNPANDGKASSVKGFESSVADMVALINFDRLDSGLSSSDPQSSSKEEK